MASARKRIIPMRKRLISIACVVAGLIVLAAVMSGQPIVAEQQAGLCRRSYPIPTTSVSYEQALASATLSPDRISVNGRAANLEITEKSMNSILRMPATVVEDC